MTSSVSLAAAFLAGLVSFISPCVLPIVPGYLSFISGVNVAQFKERGRPPRPRPAGRPHQPRLRAGLLHGLRGPRRGGDARRLAAAGAQADARDDRRGDHHRPGAPHRRDLQDPVAARGEAGERAEPPAGPRRRLRRRARLRLRLDALHRPHPGRHPPLRVAAGDGDAGRRAALGLLGRPRHPVPALGARGQLVLQGRRRRCAGRCASSRSPPGCCWSASACCS